MRSLYDTILQRLSRVTQSSVTIPEIDGLRFLAITPVVLLHLCTNYVRVNEAGFSDLTLTESWFFYLLNKGSFGVNFFFVISGFILALPFAAQYLKGEKEVRLKPYYLRRLTRLEPPFFISMMMFFLAWLVLDSYSLEDLFNSLWVSLLYVHYFVFGKWSIINPISWSLETEVQFYLIAPFLFCIFLIGNWKSRILIVLTFILGQVIFINNQRPFIEYYHLSKSLLVYFPFFLTGMLLADFYTRSNFFYREKSFAWDIAGVIGIAIIYYFHHNNAWYAPLIQSSAIAIVFVAAFRGVILNVFFTRKEIVVMGGMCYSIYLIHYGLLYLLMFFTGKLSVEQSFIVSYSVQAIIIIPIVLIISSLFFIFFEKPFMYRHWYKDFPKGYFRRLVD